MNSLRMSRMSEGAQLALLLVMASCTQAPGAGPLPDSTGIDSGALDAGAGPLQLVEESDTVVGVGARPDLIRIKDRIYVAYNKGQTIFTSDTRLLVLSTEPALLGEVDLPDPTIADAPGAKALHAMDIRLAWDGQCTLWTAVQCADPAPDNTSVTYLFASAYDVCNSPDAPALVRRSAALAKSRGGRIETLAAGTEMLDDPAPLFFNGKLHIATRYHIKPRFRVYRLSATLAMEAAWDVDAGPHLTGAATQCSLASDGTNALLFQSDGAGGPCPAGANRSNLVALGLSAPLASIDSVTALSTCNAFETYAVGPRLSGGRVYLGYQLSGCGTSTFAPRLKVFSATDMKLLDSVALTAQGVAGERVTADFEGERVFVSYLTSADWKLHLKTLRWQHAASGWSPPACP